MIFGVLDHMRVKEIILKEPTRIKSIEFSSIGYNIGMYLISILVRTKKSAETKRCKKENCDP
jgi:hypothetical protein